MTEATPGPSPAAEQPTGSAAHLVTQVQEDQQARWRRGEPVLVEAYLAQHTDLQADLEGVLDLLYNEVRLREERGEAPTLEEYLGRFPYLAPQLRRQFEVHGALRSGQETPTLQSPPWVAPATPADFLAPPQAADELGRLGDYRILKELGAGGMGLVFEAEDTHLKRHVALKVMRPEFAKNDTARQRFLREARATAALEHDHIIPIYQVGTEGDVTFLAMPLLRGETLCDRLAREGWLSPAEALRIGREIAEGLAAAHECGLIHRDIKPANVWLEDRTPKRPTGEPMAEPPMATSRVKILDFGLARPQADDARLTSTGTIWGTPAYMAPEQAAGKKVDHRCDLFSLGSVLYEMTTGQLPFPGADRMTVLWSLAVETPKPVRDLNPAVPPALADLTMRLLAKDPKDRPQTARAVAATLAAVERGQAAPPRPARRRRLGWMVAACGLLLALGAAGWFYGPVVYRFSTNQGQVVIETDDPDVEVTVRGDVVKIVDVKTGNEVTLKAGKYQLELTKGKEGLKLSTSEFTLERGGKQIVKVTRGAAAPADRTRQTRPPANAPFDAATAREHQEAWAKHYGAPTEFANAIGMKLRLIPPGRFTMGSPKNEAGRQPRENQVEVTLSRGFWLGKFEVTQAEWTATMTTQPWAGEKDVKPGGAYAATYVSWDDAVKFCQALTRNEQAAGRLASGWEYRLPTEAQWEFACRAGTESRFGFGAEKSLAEHAWLDANAKKAGENHAHEVGKKQPNAWGLHDMHGNVWEWCRDGFVDQLPGGVDPEVTQAGPVRVYRGGSWLDDEGGCRSAARYVNRTDFRMSDVGFRVALVPARADAAASPLRTHPAAAGEPFVVLDAASKKERKFATLADAVTAAQSGDTIEINGDGPPITRPIKITGKALTIRAAPGAAPTLLLLKRDPSADPADPTGHIETDSSLTLEGLAFHAIDPGNIVYARHWGKDASLRVANCRFVVTDVPRGRGHQVLAAEGSSQCEVRNCLATHRTDGWVAFLVHQHPSKGRIVLDNNVCCDYVVTIGPAGGTAKEASLKLTRNSLVPITYRLAQDAAALATDKAGGALHIDAQENVFGDPVITFAQFQDKPTATGGEAEALLRRLVAWREQRNAYPESSFLLFHIPDKLIEPTKDRRKLAEWEEFWGIGNTGSIQGAIRFQGGDLTKKAKESPVALVPTDFRLAEGSTGKGARPDGKDLGADVDLVGPGPAYERWKKTPEYRQWLKDTGQGFADDADRRAAEWVLSIGGKIQVDDNNPEDTVTTPPKERFRLTAVHLEVNQKVTDAGLAHLSDCKNLSHLDLSYTQVSDTGLAQLKDREKLTALFLTSTRVTDAGLVVLKDCNRLSRLSLADTQITNAGLANLKDCKSLTQLGLNGTQVTNAGLAHFKDCKTLQFLDLSNTKLSDEGLALFENCKELTDLRVKNTKVTADGVNKLAAALPKCKVTWDGGVIEPKINASPFVILAKGAAPERTFATLADAVAAAQSGDTIEINRDGPPITKPIKITGKALTIRAAAGAAPTLLLKREAVKDPAVNIETDSPLTLEGLAFHAIGPSSPERQSLLRSKEAPLRVAGCKFTSELPGAMQFLRAHGSQRCEVRNCQAVLPRGDAALCFWEHGSNGQLVLDNNAIAGFGFAVVLNLNGNGKEATFQFSGNSMAVSPMALILVQNAPSIEKANRSVRVNARENVVAAGGFSFGQDHDKPSATYGEAEALLKRLLQWTEQRNAYSEWLSIFLGKRGKPFDPKKEVLKLAEWETFWGIENTGSVQGRIVFQGGDLNTKAKDPSASLVPADFRLTKDSIGKGKRADGKDLGADVDLVGPGPAYERWKKTPEYQQWLRNAGPTP
jgi:formylglycine-generating enzyme required for sulfatase activity/tRNA A-37 threonylcarbamoyl transferase component Bud32